MKGVRNVHPVGEQRPVARTRWPWLAVLGAVCAVLWAVRVVGQPPPATEGTAPVLDPPQGSPARTADPARMVGPRLPGQAVYPAQQLSHAFRHDRHLARGMTCEQCHTKVAQSTRAADWNFPAGESCDACHGDMHPALPADTDTPKCAMCHTNVGPGGVTRRILAPPALLKFSHALHMGQGAQCSTCHGDMTKVGLATTLQLPRERDCLTCHDGAKATDACAACHPARADGRLQLQATGITGAPGPKLIPQAAGAWGMVHDVAFVADHAGVAKVRGDDCQSCHTPRDCQDCHQGSMRPLRLHPADYVALHAQDARGRLSDCNACHRAQTFCRGCHDRLGFGGRGADTFGRGAPRSFHPPGWASGVAVGAQGHANAAKQNLRACVSCHTEDSCLACHATTDVRGAGLGANPHGPGFRASTKCRALASRNRRVCLRCHAPGVPELDCG